MSFSSPSPLNLKLRSITFFDGTFLSSAGKFFYDVSIKKKLTVEGLANFNDDVIVEGNLTINEILNINGSVPYVDEQTGWGLPEWTVAGTAYDKAADSLIIKIYQLQELLESSYVTYTELQSATTLNNGLIYCEPNTYPIYEGVGNYSKGVTHPASDTYFVIRDDAVFPQIFQFQRGTVEVGKYLRCADSAGTVEWADIAQTIPTISGVNTENGNSSSASFYITDSGVNSNSTTRGVFYYPDYNSASSYNTKAQENDIVMLGGQGNAQNGSTIWKSFFGSFNGNQGIRFTSDSLINGSLMRGSTEIYGGGANQSFTMSSAGIRFKPELQKPILFELSLGSDTSNPQGPHHIYASWPYDPSPVAIVTKEVKNSNPLIRQSINTIPISGNGGFSDLVNAYDAVISFQDTSLHDPSSDSTPPVVTPTQSLLHIIQWTPGSYADGVSLRSTILTEETSGYEDPYYSGFTRISGCTGYSGYDAPNHPSHRTPKNYLIADRRGVTIKTQTGRKTNLYSAVHIQNKTGAMLNDQSPSIENNSFTIGTSESNVPSFINGVMKYLYAGNPSTNGRILAGADDLGTIQWKTLDEVFPSTITKSVTFTNTVTLQDTLKYTKNLPTMSGQKLYSLGNDGINGNLKWVEIPINGDGTVDQPVTFNDTINLYNEMMFFDVDFGLLTAAAVGGAAYAIGQGSFSNQKKGGQYWSSSDPALTFYWRYNDTLQTPPYTYSLKIDKTGIFSKILRVADSYAPAGDYPTQPPTDIQFYASNRTVTDTETVALNGVNYTLSPSQPGQLCVPGYFNYRAFNPLNQNYSAPTAGDMLINWGGATFTPSSLYINEYYGQATWKNMSEIFPKTVSWYQKFLGGVQIGSEVPYSGGDYGIPQSYTKTKSDLGIFGKLFFRYANSNSAPGSSPLGYYLQCVDGSTGEVQWSPSATTTLPANGTMNSLSLQDLVVNEDTLLYNLSVNGAVLLQGNMQMLGTLSIGGELIIQQLLAYEVSDFFNSVFLRSQVYLPGISPAVNRVLTCLNSSGQCEWKDVGQISIPQNPTLNSVTTNFLSIVDCLNTTNAQLSPNFIPIVDVQASTYYYGTSPDIIDPAISWLSEGTTYYVHTNPLDVGYIGVPANFSKKIYFNIPLRLSHYWCFRYANNEGEFDTESKTVYFEYWVYKLHVQIVRQVDNFVVSDGTFVTDYSTGNLGYMKCEYRRQDSNSTNGQVGPQNDVTQMTTEFTLFNGQFQFTPSFDSSIINYTIRITPQWQERYTHMDLRNYWGSNVPEHYFNNFKLVANQTAQNSFYTQTYNFQDNVTSTTAHEFQWKGIAFSHFQYPLSYPFSWGGSTYYYPFEWNFYQNDARFPTEGRELKVNSCHVKNLFINGSISSQGLTNTRGYGCRPGYGTDGGNDYMVRMREKVSQFSIYNSNYFNIDWTGEKVNTWIDASWLLSQSPNVSDYRIKSNFEPIPSVLPSIAATPTYIFDIDYENIYTARKKTGIIAHELEKNFPFAPHLVSGIKDATTFDGKIIPQTVDYNELTIMLFKAVQELKSLNDELERKVQELQSSVQALLTPN